LGVFDLASLTKPWTASLALGLDEKGLLPLETRLGEIWQGLDRRLARTTLERLLRHRSGLAPWAPLYALARDRDAALKEGLLEGRFLTAKPETYSDLGYILWTASAERATGVPLAELMRRHLFSPLGLRESKPAGLAAGAWAPGPMDRSREIAMVAKAGFSEATLRRETRRGEVNDGNALFWGGVAGHAGLFGDPVALLALAKEWIRPARVLPPQGVERALAGGRRFALGWFRRRLRGSAGPALSPSAFGHTGFTGGSLWIDAEADLICVLLAHRASADVDLQPWRRRFHALAAELE
jgi:CubicO group peptidase (beta-lactamase class C family)